MYFIQVSRKSAISYKKIILHQAPYLNRHWFRITARFHPLLDTERSNVRNRMESNGIFF